MKTNPLVGTKYARLAASNRVKHSKLHMKKNRSCRRENSNLIIYQSFQIRQIRFNLWIRQITIHKMWDVRFCVESSLCLPQHYNLHSCRPQILQIQIANLKTKMMASFWSKLTDFLQIKLTIQSSSFTINQGCTKLVGYILERVQVDKVKRLKPYPISLIKMPTTAKANRFPLNRVPRNLSLLHKSPNHMMILQTPVNQLLIFIQPSSRVNYQMLDILYILSND